MRRGRKGRAEMLELVTMPEPSGRFWTLTVLGTPVATGHVADDGKMKTCPALQRWGPRPGCIEP